MDSDTKGLSDFAETFEQRLRKHNSMFTDRVALCVSASTRRPFAYTISHGDTRGECRARRACTQRAGCTGSA